MEKEWKNLNQEHAIKLSLITRYIMRKSFANTENTVKTQILL
jgi:hypothetical protein